jgi:hypothetical protein
MRLGLFHHTSRGPLMFERFVYVTFAAGLKCPLKSLFNMIEKSHKLLSLHKVKVPGYYVNFEFERTESWTESYILVYEFCYAYCS